MMTSNDAIEIKRKYEELKKAYKEEQIAHLETKSKLLKTKEKLEVSLADIQYLNRQLSQEKQAFKEAFGHLKNTAFEQKFHAQKLKEKYKAIEKVCDDKDSVLSVKETAIKDLQSKLQQQRKTHQHQISDQEIHLQQERYLAQHYFTNYSADGSKGKKKK